jgi:hypothetical protein
LEIKGTAKTIQTLNFIDLAILVITGNSFGEPEKKLIAEFNKLDLPFIIVHNKSDLEKLREETKSNEINSFSGKEVIEFSSISDEYPEEIITPSGLPFLNLPGKRPVCWVICWDTVILCCLSHPLMFRLPPEDLYCRRYRL